MRTDQIFLIGAGGQGKVVLDALLAGGVTLKNVRVRDGAENLRGTDFLGGVIETPAVVEEMVGQFFHLAIGNGQTRQRLWAELIGLGVRPFTVIHPDASVSRFATLNEGSFVAARAIVAPSASVGVSVILNHGAVLDHDCVVGDFSHVAPNATLGGSVRVGAGVLVGAGANVLPYVTIGDCAVIGAGAVVTKDVANFETVMGVPARKIK